MDFFQEVNQSHQIEEIAKSLKNINLNSSVITASEAKIIKENLAELLKLLEYVNDNNETLAIIKNILNEILGDYYDKYIESYDSSSSDSSDDDEWTEIRLLEKIKKIEDMLKLVAPPGSDATNISTIKFRLISNLDENCVINKPTFLTFIDNYSSICELSYIEYRDSKNNVIEHSTIDLDENALDSSDDTDTITDEETAHMREVAKIDGTYDNKNKILINEPGVYNIRCRLIDLSNKTILSDTYTFTIVYDPKINFTDDLQYIEAENNEEENKLYLNIDIVDDNLNLYNFDLFTIHYEVSGITQEPVTLNDSKIEVENNTIILDISEFIGDYLDGTHIKYWIEYDNGQYVSPAKEKFVDANNSLDISGNKFHIGLFNDTLEELSNLCNYSDECMESINPEEDNYINSETAINSIKYLYSSEFYEKKINVFVYPDDNSDMIMLSSIFADYGDTDSSDSDSSDSDMNEILPNPNNSGDSDNNSGDGDSDNNDPGDNDNSNNTADTPSDLPGGGGGNPGTNLLTPPIISYDPPEIDGDNVTVKIYIEASTNLSNLTHYYTTNGNTPPHGAGSAVYTAPFIIDHDCTIKAVTMHEGKDGNDFDLSEVTTFVVDLESLIDNSINLTPPNIIYNKDTHVVTMASSNNVTTRIFYTRNGLEPNLTSLPYNEPFSVTSDCIIKAIEYYESGNVFSPVRTISIEIINENIEPEPGGSTVDPNAVDEVHEYGNDFFNDNIVMSYIYNNEEHEFSYFYTFKNTETNVTYIGTYIPANTWAWQEDQSFKIKLYNKKYNKEYADTFIHNDNNLTLRYLVDTHNLKLMYNESSDIYNYVEPPMTIVHEWTQDSQKYKVNSEDDEDNNFYDRPYFKLFFDDGGTNIEHDNNGINPYYCDGLNNYNGWYIVYNTIKYSYNIGQMHLIESNPTTDEEYNVTLFNNCRNNHLTEYNTIRNEGLLTLYADETMICGYVGGKTAINTSDDIVFNRNPRKILYKNSAHIINWNLVEPNIRPMILPGVLENSKYSNISTINFKVVTPVEGDIAINPSIYDCDTYDSSLIFVFQDMLIENWTVEWSWEEDFNIYKTEYPLDENLNRQTINNESAIGQYPTLSAGDSTNTIYDIYYRLVNDNCKYKGKIHHLSIIIKGTDVAASDAEILQMLIDNGYVMSNGKLSKLITTPHNWIGYKYNETNDNDLLYYPKYRKYGEDDNVIFARTQKICLNEINTLDVESFELANGYTISVPYYMRNDQKYYLGIHVDKNNVKYWNNNVYDNVSNEAIISFECINWSNLFETMNNYIHRVDFTDINYYNIGSEWECETTENGHTITKSMIEVGTDCYGHKYEAAWMNYPFKYKKNVNAGFEEDWTPDYEDLKMTMGSTQSPYKDSYKTISSFCLQPYSIVKKINITSVRNLELFKQKLEDSFDYEFVESDPTSKIAHSYLKKQNILNKNNMGILISNSTNVNISKEPITFSFDTYSFNEPFINVRIRYIENELNYYVYTINEFNEHFDTNYIMKCEYAGASHNISNGVFKLKDISIDELCLNDYKLSFRVYDKKNNLINEETVSIVKKLVDFHTYHLLVNARVIINNFSCGLKITDALKSKSGILCSNEMCQAVYPAASTVDCQRRQNYYIYRKKVNGMHYDMIKTDYDINGYSFNDIITLIFLNPNKCNNDASSTTPTNRFKWKLNTPEDNNISAVYHLFGNNVNTHNNITLTFENNSTKKSAVFRYAVSYNNIDYPEAPNLTDISNNENGCDNTSDANNIIQLSRIEKTETLVDDTTSTQYEYYIEYENENKISTDYGVYSGSTAKTNTIGSTRPFITTKISTENTIITLYDIQGDGYKYPAINNSNITSISTSNRTLIISKPNFDENEDETQFLQREYFNINASSILLKVPVNDLCRSISTHYSDILKVASDTNNDSQVVEERIPYPFNFSVDSKFKLSEVTVTFNGNVTHIHTINDNTTINGALFNKGQIYKLIKRLDEDGHNTFINTIHINYIYTPVEANVEMQYKSS